MPTLGIDHVNVLTDDLDATIAFYEAALELRRGPSPGEAYGYRGAWLHDATGHPVVHLVWNNPDMAYGEGRSPGQSTNAVHHIAFTCQGFVAAQERLRALGLDFSVNDGIAGLRQIVVADPNAINVEMNFTGEQC